MLCETQTDNLVQATVLFETQTDNLVQASVLCETQTVGHFIVQLTILISDTRSAVAMRSAHKEYLYIASSWRWDQNPLLKCGFYVDKLRNVCINMFPLLQIWYFGQLCDPFRTVLYNSVSCAEYSCKRLCALKLRQFIIKIVCSKCKLKWQYIFP